MKQESSGVLETLKELNIKRCEQAFGHSVASWSPIEWAVAVAGEVGELCNAIKKQHRGDDLPDTEVAKEMADIVIYLDLLATCKGIDLSQAIKEKFNEVSDRRNVNIKFEL